MTNGEKLEQYGKFWDPGYPLFFHPAEMLKEIHRLDTLIEERPEAADEEFVPTQDWPNYNTPEQIEKRLRMLAEDTD